MSLTPIEVQQKTFATALRGYDLDEVDEFLDQVVTSLNDYEQRLSDAKDRIAALEAEMANRGDDESAISRALVTAQRSADKLVADAEADATRIVGEAESEASRRLDRANAEAARISEEMRAQTEALEMEKRAQRSKLEAEITAMRQGVHELRERARALVRDIESKAGELEDAVVERSASLGVAGVAGITTPVEIPEDEELHAPASEPGLVPVEPAEGDAPAHDQLEVGRIEGDEPVGDQARFDDWEGDRAARDETAGGQWEPAAVPDVPAGAEELAADRTADPVDRAEEDLVAEMSAGIEDVDEETDIDGERDVVAEAFEGGEYPDDGDYDRVRRPWESD